DKMQTISMQRAGLCVGCPPRARKCAQSWAGWGQDNQRFGKCVHKWACVLHICCSSATDAEIVLKLGHLRSISFAIGTFRGEDDLHAPGPRAKLQATRVRGPTNNGKSAPQGFAGLFGLIGGCDEVGASRPRRVWALTSHPGIRRRR